MPMKTVFSHVRLGARTVEVRTEAQLAYVLAELGLAGQYALREPYLCLGLWARKPKRPMAKKKKNEQASEGVLPCG